jgi:fatty acid desaturase
VGVAVERRSRSRRRRRRRRRGKEIFNFGQTQRQTLCRITIFTTTSTFHTTIAAAAAAAAAIAAVAAAVTAITAKVVIVAAISVWVFICTIAFFTTASHCSTLLSGKAIKQKTGTLKR